MLADPLVAYEDIGSKFGVTRQYIAQLANELGIDGTQRQRERSLRREPCIIKQFKEYPSDVRAVMNKLRRAGLLVTPYNSPQPSMPNLFHTLLKMVIVNGVLCSIQLRKGHKLRPNGRHYARFDVNDATKRAKVALWAMRSLRRIKLYVVPLRHLLVDHTLRTMIGMFDVFGACLSKEATSTPVRSGRLRSKIMTSGFSLVALLIPSPPSRASTIS
jgi:hypothetical protein